MGVGAGLYMCDVVKKVHVRYLISWWVLVIFSYSCILVGNREFSSPCTLFDIPIPNPPFLMVYFSVYLLHKTCNIKRLVRIFKNSEKIIFVIPVWYFLITESKLVKSINRNVMLLQQFLPAIRQISSELSFSRTVPWPWGNQLFSHTLPNVELFHKFFRNRLSSD